MAIFSAGPMAALSLDCLAALPARTAIARVREIGYNAVGIPAYRHDFLPERLGESGARDLGVYLAKTGLAASWMSAGRKGRFTLGAALDEDVTRVRMVIELAGGIRAAAVVAGVGRLGGAESKAASNLREALRYLAAVADSAGVSLALAAFPEEYPLCATIAGEFAAARVGMLFDPGALAFAGLDPVETAISGGPVAAVRASDSSGEEADLAPGEGRVPWRDALAALGARDYHGFATVEFAAGGDAASRATRALEILRRFGVS